MSGVFEKLRKTKVQSGLRWYEYGRLTHTKLRTPLSIAFAYVATHNHFVLDRGGKVFKQSAPIIKLPADATEDDHLGLLGLLNSSTACFWMKQVMTGKHKGDGGPAHADPAYQRFEFAGTQLENLPIPDQKPSTLSRHLDRLGHEYNYSLPAAIADRLLPTQDRLDEAKAATTRVRGRMVALQEELDWHCYHFYNLLSEELRYDGDDLPELTPGQRAFEIS